MQSRPTGPPYRFARSEPDAFVHVLLDEARLLCQFEVQLAYGMT